MSALWLFSALAIADSSTLRTSSAPFFGVKRSVCERRPDGLAAHHVGDEPALLRRDARVLELGCDLHVPYSAEARFLSPECPLNVRVGANSPSL